MRDILDIERQTAVAQGSGHLPELQSLRGIAALVVLISHCTFYYDYDPALKHWSEVFFNAHAAVVLFFVLSGYVLCKSLIRSSISASIVINFYTRRLFRIFPALWVSLVLAFIYVFLFHGKPLPNEVSAWWWPINHRDYPVHLSGYIGAITAYKTDLPLPLWTLRFELLASAIMPILAAGLMYAPTRFFLFTLVLSAFVALVPLGHKVTYLPPFLIGASIVALAPLLSERAISERSWLVIGTLGAALLLFGRLALVADFRRNYGSPSATIVEAAGAALLIAAIAVKPRPFSVFRTPLLVWFGDISYSLYLFHMPILALIAGIGGEMIGFNLLTGNRVIATILLLLSVLIVTLPLAALSYRYIELPGIRLGKQLHSRIVARVETASSV